MRRKTTDNMNHLSDPSNDGGPDPEHLALIRQGVLLWNEWRDQHGDILVDLRRADLHGLNLEKKVPPEVSTLEDTSSFAAHLAEAYLLEANLSGTNLTQADLQRADLFEADLRNASLSGTNLGGARLSRADLRKGNLAWAFVREAKLYAANLDGATLVRANLQDANLECATLKNAHISGANLSGAKLSAADLSGADFSHCDLSGADLSGADVTSTTFSHAILTNCNVEGIKFSRKAMQEKRDMPGKYIGVRGIESTYGSALFKRAVADQDFLDALKEQWSDSRRIWLFRAWGLIDYGRSLWRVMLIAFGLMIVFGAIYALWPANIGLDYKHCLPSGCRQDGFTPFYFSVVTFTTLGFGDIAPRSLVGELIVSLEVLLGYMTLGLLLAVLAEKLARRS